MGRRKIEIKAIKDDRNRSVTFLKRKGGLFKKAHELSVLCSVDVAVIIFGHNKKLYEFSSGDIQETLNRYQYYGQPHEHKGPADFKNKNGGDDDDDEDDDEEMVNTREGSIPPQQPSSLPPHLQHHSSFTHLRQQAASVSPPMANGMFPRHATPQPPQNLSRPSSRNTIRRTSSNLVPIQHAHATPPPPPNGFAYAPNPPIYNPNAPPPHPSPQPQFQPYPPHSQAPQSQPSHQQIQQAHQAYITEQRRQSQPSTLQPPQHIPPHTSPKPESQSLRPPEASPERGRHMISKSQSIFTPIEGSVLASFFNDPAPIKQRDSPPPMSKPSQPAVPRSIPAHRHNHHGAPEFAAPSRSNTSGSKSGPRPKLNLQIPSEASDGESGTVGSSPRQSGGTTSATPARGSTESHHSGLVLPPPSPSASAVLSAGASGPPNPFARPPPPTSSNHANSNAYGDNKNNIDTPMSALPSRFIADNLLPSPNGFYDWDNFGKNSAILPSPLTFPTPVGAMSSPSFERSGAHLESLGDKRRSSEDRLGDAKKMKT